MFDGPLGASVGDTVGPVGLALGVTVGPLGAAVGDTVGAVGLSVEVSVGPVGAAVLGSGVVGSCRSTRNSSSGIFNRKQPHLDIWKIHSVQFDLENVFIKLLCSVKITGAYLKPTNSVLHLLYFSLSIQLYL